MSKERLTRLRSGMLRYRYKVCGGLEFDFHTLAEVGKSDELKTEFVKLLQAA